MRGTTANTILDRELPCIEEIHQVHIIGPESDSGMRGDVQHLKLPERRGWGVSRSTKRTLGSPATLSNPS